MRTVRVLLVVVALLIGIIFGLLTAMIMRANGSKVASAALGAGGGFVSAVTLTLGLMAALGLLSG